MSGFKLSPYGQVMEPLRSIIPFELGNRTPGQKAASATIRYLDRILLAPGRIQAMRLLFWASVSPASTLAHAEQLREFAGFLAEFRPCPKDHPTDYGDDPMEDGRDWPLDCDLCNGWNVEPLSEAERRAS